MKSVTVFLFAVVTMVATGGAALAQSGPIDTYCTYISENDKTGSQGQSLADAGSILRMDRANYHKFGLRDQGDEEDSVFASTSARTRLPDMLNNGSIDADLEREIVYDTVNICVDIYRDAIDVFRPADEWTDTQETADNTVGDPLPYFGNWDCGVATFSFTADTYNNGSEDLPIQEVQEGTDGSWSLFLTDDYYVTVLPIGANKLSWLSSETGDSFECTRIR